MRSGHCTSKLQVRAQFLNSARAGCCHCCHCDCCRCFGRRCYHSLPCRSCLPAAAVRAASITWCGAITPETACTGPSGSNPCLLLAQHWAPSCSTANAEATRCLKNGVLVENDEGSVARYLDEHPEVAAQIGVPWQ